MATGLRAGVLALCLSSALALLSDNPNHNILYNGDFEMPGLKRQARVVTGIDTRAHPFKPRGWEVLEGAIKYVRKDRWRAASGGHSVALNGNDGASSIAQTFKTVPGSSYFVKFKFAGEPGLEGWAHRTMRVSVMAGNELLAEKDFLLDTYRHKKYDTRIRWEEHYLGFTATEDRATLTFASTTDGPHGPVLDHVRVFKRDALTGFLRSPNTVYNTRSILTIPFNISAEECARRCLETHDCTGFTLGTEFGKPPGPCQLKAFMQIPAQVGEYTADSYIRKDVDCTFGHHNVKPCAQVLPIGGLSPMACVARRGWKRTEYHPFPGVCKALEITDMCHLYGGYFPLGMPAIGSGDHLKRCSCKKSALGLAALECTKTF